MKPYSRVVMKWRLRSWKPESHFSTVELEIEQNRDDTTLRMKQKRVPSSAVDTTKQGWKVRLPPELITIIDSEILFDFKNMVDRLDQRDGPAGLSIGNGSFSFWLRRLTTENIFEGRL